MRDEFNYESPLGWLGRIADRSFLESIDQKGCGKGAYSFTCLKPPLERS